MNSHQAFSSTVGVAVIGYGYWGPNLVRNFANTEGARVLSVSDLDPERLLVAQTTASRCRGNN